MSSKDDVIDLSNNTLNLNKAKTTTIEKSTDDIEATQKGNNILSDDDDKPPKGLSKEFEKIKEIIGEWNWGQNDPELKKKHKIIKIKHPEILFDLGKDSKMPTRISPNNAGLILYSSENSWIFPNTRKLIKTGLRVLMYSDTCGQIISLQDISIRDSVDVVTSLIDEDFDGEIKVLIINNGIDIYEINKHDPIAQMIVYNILYPNPVTDKYFEEQTCFRWLRKTEPDSFGYYIKDGGYHKKYDIKRF
jgi:dUTP pyrophosphatase